MIVSNLFDMLRKLIESSIFQVTDNASLVLRLVISVDRLDDLLLLLDRLFDNDLLRLGLGAARG